MDNMKHIFKATFGLLLFSVFGVMTAAAQSQFVLEVPSVVAADEMFRIVYTATSDEKISDFSAPASFEGFEVLAGPVSSTFSQTQIINGKRTHSRSQSYTYTVRPLGTGKFTLPAATIKIGKNTVTSNTVQVEVVKSSDATASASSSGAGGNTGQRQPVAGSDLKLELTVDKSEVVAGEPVIATLKLYVKQSDIGGFEDVRFPTFNGFWSQEIESPQNIVFQRENYKGEVYNAALLRKYMLLPQQTGKLSIDPAELVCQVRVRSNSRSQSIFDDFFDSYQTVRKRLHSETVTVNVVELPKGAPASFNGGVGQFSMEIIDGSREMKAHEAGSVKVRISGSGNINLIGAPKVKFPSEFEVYDMKKTDDIKSGINGASGSVIYEFPFIPRVPGEYVLPPVEVSFYDIKSKNYRSLRVPPIKIKVDEAEKNDAIVVASGGAKQSVKSLGEDIRYIAASPSGLHETGAYMIVSVWLYVAVAAVVALCAAAWLLLRRRIAMMGDTAGMKNRKALKVARMRLKKAEGFLKQNQYSPFYEELHKALDGYISDKLMLPVAELSRDRIAEELAARHKGEAVIKALSDILDACEYARYAPSAGAHAMEEHYNAAVEVISEIEK